MPKRSFLDSWVDDQKSKSLGTFHYFYPFKEELKLHNVLNFEVCRQRIQRNN